MQQFKSTYNEDEIINFFEAHIVDGEFQASKVLGYENTRTHFMMVVYSIILAVEKNYVINICDELVETSQFVIKDFIIKKTLY